MNGMKKTLTIGGIYAGAFGAAIFVLTYSYRKFDFFRALFEGRITDETPAGAESAAAMADQVESIAERAASLSFWLLVFVLLLQIFAFITAILVYRGISQSSSALEIRVKKMENADLFLDLPLYFGLFGTVSSFIVMSFNPQISRLIAYSSTLVGIIFSVFLRLCLQYPLKQRFLTEQETGANPVKE